jgi:hypothetical protein
MQRHEIALQFKNARPIGQKEQMRQATAMHADEDVGIVREFQLPEEWHLPEHSDKVKRDALTNCSPPL